MISIIVTAIFLIFVGAGVFMISIGESYRRQGKTFPARFGDSTPPSLIVFCGVMFLVLAISFAVSVF